MVAVKIKNKKKFFLVDSLENLNPNPMNFLFVKLKAKECSQEWKKKLASKLQKMLIELS